MQPKNESTRIVTEGLLTIHIDPIDMNTVRITIWNRMSGIQIMSEVVGVTDSNWEQKRPAS